MIPTAKGELPREELVVSFEITENDTAFAVNCIWKHGDEEVRRDVWVNMKRGVDLGTTQGNIGG